MATAPPTAIRISSAAARKIFSVSEKRGGSGAGSLSPLIRSSPEVTPGTRGSVAFICGVGWRRLVVLAVLVLVGLGREAGNVDPNREGRGWPGSDRHRLLRLGSLLLPDPYRVRSGGDALELEGAIGSRDGDEIRVDDHHEADHLGMDV